MSQLESFRKALLAERRSVLESLGLKVDGLAQSGPVPEEDQAQISYDEFVALTINTMDYAKLRHVNDALARMDAGEYGVCHSCEEPIPEKRLRAIPWAKYCVPCQEEIALLEKQQRDEEMRSDQPLFAA